MGRYIYLVKRAYQAYQVPNIFYFLIYKPFLPFQTRSSELFCAAYRPTFLVGYDALNIVALFLDHSVQLQMTSSGHCRKSIALLRIAASERSAQSCTDNGTWLPWRNEIVKDEQ